MFDGCFSHRAGERRRRCALPVILLPILLLLGACAAAAVTSVDAAPPQAIPAASPCSAPASDGGTLAAFLRAEPRSALEALRPTAGPLHQPIGTPVALAQGWYDEGLVHLAAYDWLRAAQAFHRARVLDPQAALAEVGLARAAIELEDFGLARYALQAAETILAEAAASPEPASGPEATPDRAALWQRIFAQKLAALCAPVAERAAALAEYRRRIDALLAVAPLDADALTVRGVASEVTAAGRGQGGGSEAAGYFLRALQAAPEHIAAHHFLVHAYENLGRHEAALPHAEKLAAGAPTAPHAQHMVGHVLARSERWQESLPWFLRADALHRVPLQGAALADPRSAEIVRRYDWHFGHNLRVLGMVEWELGQKEAARGHLQETSQLQFVGWRSRFYTTPWIEHLLLERRWPEALAAARALGEQGSQPGGTAQRAFAELLTAEALLGLGRPAQARQAAQRARVAEQEVMAEADSQPAGYPIPWLVRDLAGHLARLFELSAAPSAAAAAELRARYAAEADQQTTFDGWITARYRLHRLEPLP
jgi:tetratricopeptide (TPR) repeat protein